MNLFETNVIGFQQYDEKWVEQKEMLKFFQQPEQVECWIEERAATSR